MSQPLPVDKYVENGESLSILVFSQPILSTRIPKTASLYILVWLQHTKWLKKKGGNKTIHLTALGFADLSHEN